MGNTDDHNCKWKRILLIKPNYRAVGWDFYNMDFPPINLTYIASYVSDLNIEIDILDAKVENLSNKQIKKKIQIYKPDLVGISVYVSAAIDLSNQIAKIVKDVGSHITVVLGGRHPTFECEECLENEYVDIVVRGEGEVTFKELIMNGSPKEIRGISFKKNNEIIHNPERELMSKKEYANIKIPSRHLIKNNKYKMFTVRLETVETSRGCPYSCKFCTTWKVNNGKWRARPIKNVIEELRTISQNKKITDIFFVDDELTANTKRVEKLCESIIKSKKEGLINDFKFFAQIRVDDIVRSPEMIKKMAEAGFWVVFIGIESVDEASLKEMRKGISFNHVLRALDILHENNILAIGNLIIGVNLNDTREDIKRNIRVMKDVDIDIISFVILTPFPGSDTLEEMDTKGLVLTKNWSKYTVMEPVIKTNQLSPSDLYELLFYSFHELKYIMDIKKVLGRVRKTRGLRFLLNPKRIISAIKSFFAVRTYINGYNLLTKK